MADIYRLMEEHRAAVGDPRDDQRERRFRALYAAHHAHVFGYVMRRCDRADDAADAIAETFLVAWRRLEDAPNGENRRLWLYGIARRVLANQRRGERRRLALAERLRSDLAAGATAANRAGIDALGELESLRIAFRKLSPDDRELLALQAWEELSSEQIAGVLGCSSAAARTRLHRARRRLQRAIDQAAVNTTPSPRPHPKQDPDRPEAIEGGI